MGIFKSIKQAFAYRISGCIPPRLWSSLCNIDLVVPYWHLASDDELAHVSGIYSYRNCEQFSRDIEYLLKHYEPVSLAQVIAKIDRGDKFKKPSFIATFDDGFREVYEVIAPILFKKGVPAIFFITTLALDNRELLYPQKKRLLLKELEANPGHGRLKEILIYLDRQRYEKEDISSIIKTISYSERSLLDELAVHLSVDFKKYLENNKPYLTSDQVNTLIKQGFDIGAHSIDHPRYQEISLEDQLYQTIQSANFLSHNFGYVCNSFAFPFGDTGISHEFFKRLFDDGSIKVTFGTSGLIKNGHVKNIPRILMEGSAFTARQIISRQYARLLYYIIMKRI